MNIIELSNVHYKWQLENHTSSTKQFCLRCDEFTLKQSESAFLQGASGSGKSTLLGLVCGTISPQQGRVNVTGKCISDMTGAAADIHRADTMGIIFQSFNLIPYLNALQNILLPLHFSSLKKQRAGSNEKSRIERAINLLEKLGLNVARDAHSIPDQLSIGQQQRVAAARALIGKPELIIADEPTSALDEDNQVRFIELLLSQVEECNASLLMVSHNKRLKNHFQNFATLENGVLYAGDSK